jgi:hypothetical protein
MANLNHQLVQLTATRISSKQKKMEFKMKLKTLDSDEGVKIDSGRGTKIYLNRRPSGSYVAEIAEEKNSKMDHPSENIRFIQNIDEIIALVEDTLGKSFAVIDY